VADKTVEVDLFLFDGFKEGFLTDGYSTCGGGLLGDLAAFGADDGNLPIALDGVGKSNAVLDDGAITGSLEVDVNFVLDRSRRLSNLDGSQDSIEY
jgi:hypothetical protein